MRNKKLLGMVAIIFWQGCYVPPSDQTPPSHNPRAGTSSSLFSDDVSIELFAKDENGATLIFERGQALDKVLLESYVICNNGKNVSNDNLSCGGVGASRGGESGYIFALTVSPKDRDTASENLLSLEYRLSDTLSNKTQGSPFGLKVHFFQKISQNAFPSEPLHLGLPIIADAKIIEINSPNEHEPICSCGTLSQCPIDIPAEGCTSPSSGLAPITCCFDGSASLGEYKLDHLFTMAGRNVPVTLTLTNPLKFDYNKISQEGNTWNIEAKLSPTSRIRTVQNLRFQS